jgi:type IV pilus assembly protein PilB
VLIGEMLIQAKCITREQLSEALTAPREPGKKIGQILIERGWVTEAQLTQTLSLQLSVPWVSLYHIDFSRQLLNRVSRDLAERFCLIPIFVRHVKGQGETLYVAMDDPTNEQALVDVSRLAGLPARPMIASASDIRSAIRVYYGDPNANAANAPVIDVPPPPTRVEGRDVPVTAREGRGRVEPPSGGSPPTPQVPTQPERSGPVARPASQPPPPLPARRPPQQAAQAAAQAGAQGPTSEDAPPTTRSNPPPGGVAEAAREADAKQARRRPIDDEERGRRRARMLSLTLLDGTQIKLPASKKKTEAAEGLTARDFVSALRASAHGADASEVLGEQVRWEPVVAALLSILLRKGLIADWEFVEELRKS